MVKIAGGENPRRIRVGVYRLVYEIHDREIYSVRLLMGQIGEGIRWTAGILPEW